MKKNIASVQSEAALISGRVIEEQKNYFLVDTEQGVIRGGTTGALKKVRARVCVGDFVQISITSIDPPIGIISKIEERSSFIRRPALANLTQIFLIASRYKPALDLEALDRMFFSAEAYGITPVLVFNKIDTLDSEDITELDHFIDIYKKCGYQVLSTSALTGDGIESLASACSNGISAFTGLSGVGKSTLLSKIFPDIHFRIGEVSQGDGRGTHTTTNIVLHPFTSGSYIADTPGLSFIDIPTVPEENVVACFPEIAACVGKCRFNNCIHDGEPGCHVQEQIDNGEIDSTRRYNYLKIYNEMKTIRRQYRK